jgi:hypothetical protein
MVSKLRTGPSEIVWSRLMVGEEPDPNVVIVHPARDKPAVKATKAVVILLMLISVALMLIVAIGGWALLLGMKPILIGFAVVYLILAYYAGRWNRGVLPVVSALAIMLLIFAAVSGPEWIARDKSGFASASIPSDLLGLLTLLIIPVQILLIAFAMRGFSQEWHVEVEQPVEGGYAYGGADPATA